MRLPAQPPRRPPLLAGPAAAAAASLLPLLLLPAAASSFSLDLHRAPRVEAAWAPVDHSPPGAGAPRRRIEPPRSGHVAFVADGGGDGRGGATPHVFGGYCEVAADDERGGGEGESGTPARYAANDLWRWRGDGDDDAGGAGGGGWEKVEQRGDVPGPRLASAAAVLGGRPYLFGGWDPQTPGTGGTILDSVHRLDPSTGTWSELPVTVPGGPTSRHVALALPGGTEALIHNHRCADHVLVFDSTTEEFRAQKTTGTAPSPRGLHCAAMCGRHAAVFGGAAQSGLMSNEAFLLDTDTWEWTELRFAVGGDGGGGTGAAASASAVRSAPSPRAGAAMCPLSPTCALVFGGAETTESGLNGRADLWALHFDAEAGAGRWELLVDDDNSGEEDDGGVVVPPPRNAATLTEIESGAAAAPADGVGGEDRAFLLQGGWAPFRTTWGDSYVLNVRGGTKTDRSEWVRIV